MLGFPILYPKGMRIMMFQLSGFYCTMGPMGRGLGPVEPRFWVTGVGV